MTSPGVADLDPLQSGERGCLLKYTTQQEQKLKSHPITKQKALTAIFCYPTRLQCLCLQLPHSRLCIFSLLWESSVFTGVPAPPALYATCEEPVCKAAQVSHRGSAWLLLLRTAATGSTIAHY